MVGGIALGWLALAARAVTVGAFPPLLKRLNEGQSAMVVTALFTLFGSLVSLIPAGINLALDPTALDGFAGWVHYPIAGSVAFTIGMVSFNRALRVGDVSLLAPLTALTFVFVYVLDLAVDNTDITLTAVFGILVVTVGMALLNLRPGIPLKTALMPFAVMRQPGAWGALTFAAGLAVARVVDNEGMEFTSAPVYAAVAHIMVFMLCLVIVLIRRQQRQVVALARLRGGLAALIATIGLLNYLFLLTAYHWFNPSTVEPVSQIGIVGSVLIGAWLYREPLHLRWLAAILVVAGAALVVIAR
jgi:drug/metabolite transporter (DMT)-like permease